MAETRCVNQVAGGRSYPYSVTAIRRALDAGPARSKPVKVLIVDNNFYGFRVNDRANATDRRARIPSRNFPDAFFKIGNNDDFSPWIAEANPPADIPDETEPLITWHGTHVAGIILGGMYDDNRAPDEQSNVREPNARSLLLDQDGNKSWLEISFLTIQYGSGRNDRDPIERLNGAAAFLDSPEIINMSLGKALTGAETVPILSVAGPLIITSAGNSGRKLARSLGNLQAIPATLSDDDGRMLVVASHDADQQLSYFSNFGKFVNIAAPGCQIRSWINGEADAVPLSGTSMATAIVTFAAALVRSRWEPTRGAAAIRNRILASARYEPKLRKCSKLNDVELVDSVTYCVKDGAMLDIEAAVNVSHDLIEYDDCGPAGQACETKTAIGELTGELPEGLRPCLTDVPADLLYHGLSYNGALKRMDRNQLLVAYETGNRIGDEPLHTEVCALTSSDAQIQFRIEGPQPDGRNVQPDPSPATTVIQLRNLKRLVTRVN